MHSQLACRLLLSLDVVQTLFSAAVSPCADGVWRTCRKIAGNSLSFTELVEWKSGLGPLGSLSRQVAVG